MERIVYIKHEFAGSQRVATKTSDGRWMVFVGKLGGDLRRYKTESAMNKEMEKRGYTRYENP